MSFSEWWINKLWCTLTMEYYSALKRNEPSAKRRQGGNLRSQSVRDAHYMITTMWHSGKGKTIQTSKGSVVARGWWGERWTGGAERIFRAVIQCYNDRCISWYLCPNLQSVQHQEWVLMSTADVGWWWPRFLSCNMGTTWSRKLITRRLCLSGGRGRMGNLCTFPSILKQKLL